MNGIKREHDECTGNNIVSLYEYGDKKSVCVAFFGIMSERGKRKLFLLPLFRPL
jgi:hypothetical protein